MSIVLFSADTFGDDGTLDGTHYRVHEEDGSVIMVPLASEADLGAVGVAGSSQSTATPVIPVTPVNTGANKRRRATQNSVTPTNTGNTHMDEYFKTLTQESIIKANYYELKIKKLKIEIDILEAEKEAKECKGQNF